MDSSSPAITALEHIQLFTYLDVASIAILLFDYLITIDLEVKYIWGSRLTILDLMFIFTRYLPFVESGVLLYRTFASGLSTKTCSRGYKVNALLIVVGIAIGEFILSVRTWAVWGRSKKVGIGLIIFSCAAAIPAIPVIIHFSDTAQWVDPPYQPFRGCFLQGGSRILPTADWIILMVYDGGLLVLMTLRAIKSLPVTNKSFMKAFFTPSRSGDLLQTILKDGILTYLYLFVLSSLNVAVIRAMPIDYLNLLTMIERVLHAVLTCRVVLHIKESGSAGVQDDTMHEAYVANTRMEFETEFRHDLER